MSERTSLWYFEEVDLYNVLCPHKVPDMKERHTFNHFRKDQFIYFPNEPSSHIYLIAEGRVKIGSYTEDGKEILKAILGAGEIFGELSIAGEERRTDFAQALDPNTTVCPMTIDDMQELMKENQALSLRIFKLMGLRLKRVERKLESLVFKDARSRVIDFIREMAEERGQKVGYEMLIKTKFTHKDIASLTGTSRQTVTTILNELKSQNVINFDRRRILVRDMDKLK
ncbi:MULTISPECIES: Crp/Fnr family transcriptional regulator [unclassified Imperialibacter]|uniref:Crp/Fnr family transcriptional regulator n=1 Tax=unclassified Imperialibacter TaxID=2629706 RepID=UPI00125719F3|nr:MULTISPECIES: Crp/Fnr family transcriptional regulator [unclassified Imperialibacter]CAD5273559.1 cAMP-binding protein [Imperialibacter sp. 89]CAD5289228.1 cAMP-binding protein [Imperialibacter sp. 75]VVT14052.1 cAMP-binding protein [Imperialibacter sp. EC-SDR9]